MSILKYKGYIAKIDFSEQDEEFFGEVINTSRDGFCFGGKTVAQLKKHFKEIVNGYIANCKTLKMQPKKPYPGRITLRMTPQEHAMLVETAFRKGCKSLNEWMNKVLIHEAERSTWMPTLTPDS